MYQRILVSTDGSELSQKAVDAGIALATSLKAQLFVFTATPQYPSMYMEGAVVLTPAETARIEKEWQAQSEMVLDGVQKTAAEHDLSIIRVLGHGAVAEGVILAAKKHGCDLIVMASHGRKGIGRLLLGSETLDVLTHSHIPVLVLR